MLESPEAWSVVVHVLIQNLHVGGGCADGKLYFFCRFSSIYRENAVYCHYPDDIGVKMRSSTCFTSGSRDPKGGMVRA